MEVLFEFLTEFVMEVLFDASKSKRIPLWVRVSITVLLSFVYLFLMTLCLAIGIRSFQINDLLGSLLIGFGVFLGIACFIILWKKNK